MWRDCQNDHCGDMQSSSARKCPTVRLQSTNPLQDPKKSNVASTVVALVGTAALGTGCVIGYAKYDPKFRKTLEENVPFSKNVLSALPEWKDITSSSEKSKAVIKPRDRLPSLSEQKAIEEEGFLKKRLEREAQKRQKAAESQESPVLPLPMPVSNIPDKADSKSAQDDKESAKKISTKKTNEEELKQRLLQEETRNLEINDRLETDLKESLLKVETILANALTAQSAAVDAIKQHTKKLYNALDSTETENLDETWKEANAAMSKKMHCQEMASKKLAEMKEATQKLKATIKEGMESKITAENPILITAEESINKMLNQLKKMEEEVAGAHAESNVADNYKSMFEKGKEQFRKELEAIVPNVKMAEKGNKLSEEELNMLIAHAHQRVEHLQKQLAKHQVTEREHVQHALAHQKKKDEEMIENKVQMELNRQKHELEMEFLKKTADIKDQFELDMRQQLRRQAAAHSEHLQDALEAQGKKLEKIKELALEEKVVEERSKFQEMIGSSLAKLSGIESGLKAREKLDKAAKRAQELWLACQSMKESIRTGQPELRPLCSEVEAIRRCVDPSDSYLIAVLNSIPQQALTRGVYTEEALKERFTHVDKTCRRVALIDNDHRSLYHYFLSLMQSFLIVDESAIPKEEICNEIAVDPTKWNTFDILKRVRYSIVREDLQQAIRYANQLTGEPKNVANSWIRETLLLLETRQAIEALIAHAAAISVQAYN